MWQVLRTTRSASSPSLGVMPGRGEQFAHPLAVIDVHLAAEALDAIGLGKVGHCGAGLSASARTTEGSAAPIVAWAARASALRSATGGQRVEQAHRDTVRALQPEHAQRIGQPALAAMPGDRIERRRHSRSRPGGRRVPGGGGATASSRVDRNGSKAWPLPVVPSGKTASGCGVAKRGGDPADLAMRVAALGALDVQRVILVGEPADQRARAGFRPSTRSARPPSRPG